MTIGLRGGKRGCSLVRILSGALEAAHLEFPDTRSYHVYATGEPRTPRAHAPLLTKSALTRRWRSPRRAVPFVINGERVPRKRPLESPLCPPSERSRARNILEIVLPIVKWSAAGELVLLVVRRSLLSRSVESSERLIIIGDAISIEVVDRPSLCRRHGISRRQYLK